MQRLDSAIQMFRKAHKLVMVCTKKVLRTMTASTAVFPSHNLERAVRQENQDRATISTNPLFSRMNRTHGSSAWWIARRHCRVSGTDLASEIVPLEPITALHHALTPEKPDKESVSARSLRYSSTVGRAEIFTFYARASAILHQLLSPRSIRSTCLDCSLRLLGLVGMQSHNGRFRFVSALEIHRHSACIH